MDNTMENLSVGAADGVNYVLENQYIRVFVFVLAAVYAGYTLRPVPKTLEKLFDNSNLFKFIILFFLTCSMLYPLNEKNVKFKITSK